MSIPFHKQTDPNKQAGQIVFSPEAPNTTSPPENLTLAGYIKTVKRAQAFDDVANEKKLTFEEWWKKYDGGPDYSNTGIAESAAEDIWNAALTKGKL